MRSSVQFPTIPTTCLSVIIILAPMFLERAHVFFHSIPNYCKRMLICEYYFGLHVFRMSDAHVLLFRSQLFQTRAYLRLLFALMRYSFTTWTSWTNWPGYELRNEMQFHQKTNVMLFPWKVFTTCIRTSRIFHFSTHTSEEYWTDWKLQFFFGHFRSLLIIGRTFSFFQGPPK